MPSPSNNSSKKSSLRDLQSAGKFASDWAKSQSKVASYTQETQNRLKDVLKTSKEWRHTLESQDIFKDSNVSIKDMNKLLGDGYRQMLRSSAVDVFAASTGSMGALFKGYRSRQMEVATLEAKQAADNQAVAEHLVSLTKRRVQLTQDILNDNGLILLAEQDLAKARAANDTKAVDAHERELQDLLDLRKSRQQDHKDAIAEANKLKASAGQRTMFQQFDLAMAKTKEGMGTAGELFMRSVKPVVDLQFQLSRSMPYLIGGARTYQGIVAQTIALQGSNPLLSDADAAHTVEAFQSKSRTYFPNGSEDIATAAKLSFALNISADASSEIAFNLRSLGQVGQFGRIASTMAAFAKQTDLTNNEVAELVNSSKSLMSALPDRIKDKLIPQILAIGSAFKRIGLDGKEFIGKLEDMTNIFSDSGVLSAVFSTGRGMSFGDVMGGGNMSGAAKNFAGNVGDLVKNLKAGGMEMSAAAHLAADITGATYEQAKRFGSMGAEQRARFDKDLDQAEELSKQSDALDAAMEDQMDGPMQMFRTWGTLFSNSFKQAGIWLLNVLSPFISGLASLGGWLNKHTGVIKVLGAGVLVLTGYMALRFIPTMVRLGAALMQAAFGANALTRNLGGGVGGGRGGFIAGMGGRMGVAGVISGVLALGLSVSGATEKMGKFGEVLESVLSVGAVALPLMGMLGKTGVGAGLMAGGSSILGSLGGTAMATLTGVGGIGGGTGGSVAGMGAGALTANLATGLASLALIKGTINAVASSVSNDDGLNDNYNNGVMSGIGNNASAFGYRVLNGASFGLLDKMTGKNAADAYQKETDAKLASANAQMAIRKGGVAAGAYGTDSGLESDTGFTQTTAENMSIASDQRNQLDISRNESPQVDEARREKVEKQEDRREYRAHLDLLKGLADTPLLGGRQPNSDLLASSTFASGRPLFA